jgi:pimeloyl-ACP methyl ester carboxylesterase
MAEDAMAILEAAGVRRPAFLMGASMGGMIAQEMVLRYPDRFRALLLGCTACGPVFRAAWPNFARAPGFWRWLRLRGEERERAVTPLLYSDSTPHERIDEDIRMRAACQASVNGVLNQLVAILRWSSYRRLPEIRIPTLVVHGDQDHMLPAANGQMVATRIPNAEFVLLPQTGHIITTDQPELAAKIVLDFLERVAIYFCRIVLLVCPISSENRDFFQFSCNFDKVKSLHRPDFALPCTRTCSTKKRTRKCRSPRESLLRAAAQFKALSSGFGSGDFR